MKRQHYHKPRFKADHPRVVRPKLDRDEYEDDTGEAIIIEFDGSCFPNPGGIGSYGYKIYTLSDEGVTGCDKLPRNQNMSNNTAEWSGLKAALIHLAELLRINEISGDKLVIFGDSQLVIRQLTGKWRVNYPHLAALKNDCLDLLGSLPLPRWDAKWVARKHNIECDALAEQAAQRVDLISA